MSSYLERGTKVCRSKRGHKGFFYPDPELWDTTTTRASVKLQPWVGSKMVAVLISEDSIFSTGRADRLIPVWVEKSDLVKY